MGIKKLLLSLALPVELLFSGCSSQNSIDSRRWPELQNNSPKDLIEAHAYLRNIYYVKEGTERWDSAKTIVEKGYGDCEEIAILGCYFAEKLGYPPEALFLVDEKEGGHLITLLEEKTLQGKKYGAFEHTNLFYPVYDSIDELVKCINKTYRMNYLYYSILELNSLDKNWRNSEKNLLNKNKRILALKQIKLPEKDKEKVSETKKRGYRVGSFILKK